MDNGASIPLSSPGSVANPLAALRRFARPRKQTQERCDLCSAVIGPEHEHLLDPQTRQLQCSCYACALLFDDVGKTKYRRVPRTIEHWSDFQMSDEQWNGLNIPINLAFFFQSSAGKIVVMYPSAGGTIESQLQPESWQELAEQNPVLLGLLPDVEALLVNRIKDNREYFRAPIDKCYELAGLLRTHWRGLGGGSMVWQEISRYFADLKRRSSGTGNQSHA